MLYEIFAQREEYEILYNKMVAELLEIVGASHIHFHANVVSCGMNGGFNYMTQRLTYEFNPYDWSAMDIQISSMNYIRRVFRSTIPIFVQMVYHELGHLVDYNSYHTDIVNTFLRSNHFMQRRSACASTQVVTKYYRNLYHEKWADLYSVDVWEIFGQQIIEVLEKYDKLGLPHLFD